MRKIKYIFLFFIMIVCCFSCGKDKTKPTPVEPITPQDNPDPIVEDKGELKFELSTDGLSYVITGIGTYKDSNLEVPSIINELPVTNICEGAFYGVTFNSVSIPKDVNVEKGAFNHANIKELTIPTLFGGYLGYIFGGERASTNKSVVSTQLETVILTNETIILNTAFTGCVSLIKVVLNNDITEIGANAFYNCENLNNITLPQSLNKIDENAFYNCNNLESVYYSGTVESWSKIVFATLESTPMCFANKFYLNNNLLEELNIPENINNILDYSFAGFRCIKKVCLPSTLKSIGYKSFFDLKCNEEYKITNSDTYKTIDGVLFEGKKLISYPIGSTQNIYTIPSFVTEISNNAFYDAANLENINFGESNINTIGEAAFKNCINLKSIELPVEVVKLESELLMGCSNITSIKISENATYIGQSCFESCTIIEKIVVPILVDTIKEYAFRHCDNLTIYCCASKASKGWVSSYWNVYPARPVVWNYVEE